MIERSRRLLLRGLRRGRDCVFSDVVLEPMQRVIRLLDHAGAESRTPDGVKFLADHDLICGKVFTQLRGLPAKGGQVSLISVRASGGSNVCRMSTGRKPETPSAVPARISGGAVRLRIQSLLASLLLQALLRLRSAGPNVDRRSAELCACPGGGRYQSLRIGRVASILITVAVPFAILGVLGVVRGGRDLPD
jgi:hypothetical protein